MKNLVIIANVLAVMTVVYGFNAENLQKFNQDFAKCNEELGGSAAEHRAEKVKCALAKGNKSLNANSEIVKEELLKSFEDGISDASKLKQAKTLFNKCYDEGVKSGSTGNEQTMKIITCSLPILDLLDNIN